MDGYNVGEYVPHFTGVYIECLGSTPKGWSAL